MTKDDLQQIKDSIIELENASGLLAGRLSSCVDAIERGIDIPYVLRQSKHAVEYFDLLGLRHFQNLIKLLKVRI